MNFVYDHYDKMLVQQRKAVWQRRQDDRKKTVRAAAAEGHVVVKASQDPFTRLLSDDIEHLIHEYLPISDLITMQEISHALYLRVKAALREPYWWDVVFPGEDQRTYELGGGAFWLARIADTCVRVRSIEMSQNQLEWAMFEAGKKGLTSGVELLARVKRDDFQQSVKSAFSYRWGTPLYQAAANGHGDIVKLFLAIPEVNPNFGNDGGISPLSQAAKYGYTDIVSMLLEAPNILVNRRSTPGFGDTPLHEAARYGHVDIVKKLLATPGINANSRSPHKGQQTPLHMSVRSGNVAVVKVLLATDDVDVHAMNVNDETVLHIGAQNDSRNGIAVMKLLLEVPDINFKAENIYGDTPAQVARDCGNMKIAYLLWLQHMRNTCTIF